MLFVSGFAMCKIETLTSTPVASPKEHIKILICMSHLLKFSSNWFRVRFGHQYF